MLLIKRNSMVWIFWPILFLMFVFIPVDWSKQMVFTMFRKLFEEKKKLHEISLDKLISWKSPDLQFSSALVWRCLMPFQSCLFVFFSFNVWFIPIMFFRSVSGLPFVLIAQCFKTPRVWKTSLWSESPFVLQTIILKSKPTALKAKFL